ncbi:helix-turn-helix transcriptional regulator [Virgibacillus halophilus]|uniref:Helix-turn-helix domain-containing protein n=1 Tax=Tigheibacillus halophilus TaxID=361280 RepID=A0ABU5CBG6_9BACI|nr:helix-turn-helix domain-containing protein [Virgibacillus halophilus]
MQQTLKITSVLSDPTRFNIYQYMIEKHQDTSVNDIANKFDIHPNVARMHLNKLEDIQLLVSYAKKNGKGGRPSRLFRLSEKVIDLHFPHRDYKLLSAITLETLAGMGEIGKHALFETGRKYGYKLIANQYPFQDDWTPEKKIKLLEEASCMLGMYASYTYLPDKKMITFSISNCPFKELADMDHEIVCEMHHDFLRGMLEALFTNIELSETQNMFHGCENCAYVAKLADV